MSNEKFDLSAQAGRIGAVMNSNLINETRLKELMVNSVEELSQFLAVNNIDTSDWRHEISNKTVFDLFKEITANESQILTNGNMIWRQLKVARIEITADIDRQTYRLQEFQKYDADNKLIRRQTKCSIGEKMTSKENLSTAVIRAIKEELSLDITLDDIYIPERQPITLDNTSESFPGMPTRYYFYDTKIELSGDQIRPEYVEYQPEKGKTNYFRWELVS